jgi:hypothetical protein
MSQIALFTQRWRERRETYRPAGEPIDTRKYEVAEIGSDREPKAFILKHHYLGSYPSARFRFGLFTGGALVGTAVFSHPCNDRVLTSVFDIPTMEAVELGRFVLLDEVPANGESWFLARALELLRRNHIMGVVSFSDPIPRSAVDGTVAHIGHLGTCYQATSAAFLGRGTARTLRMLPDGSILNDRTIQKIRAGERGWQYGSQILERFGAGPAPAGETDRAEWLTRWTTALTRPLRHPGNWKYAWGLHRTTRRMLPESLPYPKHNHAQTTGLNCHT